MRAPLSNKPRFHLGSRGRSDLALVLGDDGEAPAQIGQPAIIEGADLVGSNRRRQTPTGMRSTVPHVPLRHTQTCAASEMPCCFRCLAFKPDGYQPKELLNRT